MKKAIKANHEIETHRCQMHNFALRGVASQISYVHLRRNNHLPFVAALNSKYNIISMRNQTDCDTKPVSIQKTYKFKLFLFFRAKDLLETIWPQIFRRHQLTSLPSRYLANVGSQDSKAILEPADFISKRFQGDNLQKASKCILRERNAHVTSCAHIMLTFPSTRTLRALAIRSDM